MIQTGKINDNPQNEIIHYVRDMVHVFMASQISCFHSGCKIEVKKTYVIICFVVTE